MDAITQGLQTIEGQFCMTRQEWRAHHKGGDMLLEGLESKGFVRREGDMFAVTPAGRRRIDAAAPAVHEED